MTKHPDPLAASFTSWHGHTIMAAASRLIELFGEPQTDAPSLDFRSQREWILQTRTGSVITLYDTRSSSYDIDEVIAWHVGAKTKEAAQNGSVILKHIIYLT